MEESVKEKKLSGDEIISILTERLTKGFNMNSVCEELGISSYELFGYITHIKESGINVTVTDKGDDISFIKNNHPDYAKENCYKIIEKSPGVKIGVISDLRFGSKCEQIEILNDIYKKFAEDGVKYVIVAGNLLEGKYSSKDELQYGNSLITNDAYGQADHLIQYFPYIEGIQTLFITGDKDHSWGKDLNVGKYIAEHRRDMIYLGPKSCTIDLNNVKIRVECLKKNGEAYTVAYPPQKYSRSMSSYEDYDLILLGGTLTAQDFPKIRDTKIFAIPSVTDRSPKMKATSQQNVMGSYQFNVEFNKTGKLGKVTSILSPYYVPSQKNYLKLKPLLITADSDASISKKPTTDRSEIIFTLDKMYKYIRREQPFSVLKKKLEMTDEELFGLIHMLNHYGRSIEIVDVDGELIVRKNVPKSRNNGEIKPPKEELHKKELLIVSDTHYGSIWSQPSMVNTACYEAYNRGIDTVLHIGDIVDGDYISHRPGSENTVFLYGASGFGMYVVDTLPKYDGMEWYAIQGSHDQTLEFNTKNKFCLGKYVEERRDDFHYLGQDYAIMNIDNCKIEMFHPGGGTSRILSTKPQNGIDQIPSKIKPNASFRGHYHKVYYMLYRNIHTFLCPCNVDQSSFMRKNEIPNLMGDLFVTIWYDDKGHIHYIENEAMIFDQDDVRKNDYENPKKYIKNKIVKANRK